MMGSGWPERQPAALPQLFLQVSTRCPVEDHCPLLVLIALELMLRTTCMWVASCQLNAWGRASIANRALTVCHVSK